MTMQIYVNGAPQEIVDALPLSELIILLGLVDKRMAVEVNQEVVPRSYFPTYALTDQDRIEIIHAVGGG
jgi:sulfur carrier protein